MEVWEGEGGTLPPARRQLIGSQNQVAWAEQIRAGVNAEFDRMAHGLESRAGIQAERQRSDTLAMISILEEKRTEVMAKEDAGYFIREWQDLRDQVRLMIIHDPRSKAITANRGTAAELVRL